MNERPDSQEPDGGKGGKGGHATHGFLAMLAAASQ
jgi:hypothetical protein